MSHTRVSVEFPKAITKRNALYESERLRIDNYTTQALSLHSTLRTLCASIHHELIIQLPNTETGDEMFIRKYSDIDRPGMYSEELPSCEWVVGGEGFRDSTISAHMKSPEEIHLWAGDAHQRHFIYSLLKGEQWEFHNVPYEMHKKSYAEMVAFVNEESKADSNRERVQRDQAQLISKIDTLSEVADILFADVLFSLGEDTVQFLTHRLARYPFSVSK